MTAIFKTVPWQVGQLVDSVGSGQVQLPDLQRPFVWPSSKVRDLFDSMYRGYPVGALMFWDVPAEGETRSISANAALSAGHQIIDGQQRLTSLYAAMRGVPVRDENYRSKRIVISFNPFTEKFEVRTPALAKSPAWLEDIADYFDNQIRSRKAFIRRYTEAGNTLTPDQEDSIEEVLGRLGELNSYRFDVVHIQKEVDKRQVADVFVRINSEGVRLKAADFILTWLSVFWPEGRERIEEFARASRMSPETASALSGQRITWTPINPFLEVDTSYVVRAMVGFGQNRARLQDAYAALQAKDRMTGEVDPHRQEVELTKLQAALPLVTDKVSWTEFLHSLQQAGFRSKQNVTSAMNLVYSYVLFLIGRHRFELPLYELRVLIARWVFMAQLTGRYTGSSESQLQKDLARIEEIQGRGPKAFSQLLEQIIDAQLTPDYWRYNLPQSLITSNAALSPHYQCYLAGLNILEANMFLLDMSVSTWMDPSQPTVKGMEAHHLFPRNYLVKALGTTDVKRINQAANFAPTDWDTNIEISDRSPLEYWPSLVEQRSKGDEWLRRQMRWHALPEAWHTMEYDTFLKARRELMAEVVREGFHRLSTGHGAATAPVTALASEDNQIASVRDLLDQELIRPGDQFVSIDPDSKIDATITDDSTISISGIGEYDTFDEAVHALGVTALPGNEFWLLDRDGAQISVAELLGR